jgi:hypothetical protein
MSPSAISDELPVQRAARLQQQTDAQRWLIRSVWGHLAVGWCSGHPKLGKTFFSIDLSVSVASGTDCLDTFPVEQPGPVLIYLAEDALPQVRERIAAICTHRSLDIEKLDLYVITAPSLRLDDKFDQARLIATVSRIRPRLLVLDPLVRLHSSRENDSGDIAALLGFLRTLSREHDLAITVVHHMSKKNRRQLGQALRGSSDLWAWSDSAAYLTRSHGQVLLTLEHRSAPAPEPIPLVLALGPDGTQWLDRASVGLCIALRPGNVVQFQRPVSCRRVRFHVEGHPLRVAGLVADRRDKLLGQ